MPFPLPNNIEYRKLLIKDWIQDVYDRIEQHPETAEESWKIANRLFLKLGPGQGDPELEQALVESRVKLASLKKLP